MKALYASEEQIFFRVPKFKDHMFRTAYFSPRRFHRKSLKQSTYRDLLLKQMSSSRKYKPCIFNIHCTSLWCSRFKSCLCHVAKLRCHIRAALPYVTPSWGSTVSDLRHVLLAKAKQSRQAASVSWPLLSIPPFSAHRHFLQVSPPRVLRGPHITTYNGKG